MNILIQKKDQRFFVLIAVLLLASLVLAFFHHHDDGKNDHQCPICHFVKYVVGLLVLLFAAVAAAVSRSSCFREPDKLESLLLSSGLHGRAPPALS